MLRTATLRRTFPVAAVAPVAAGASPRVAAAGRYANLRRIGARNHDRSREERGRRPTLPAEI